jgi:hypothetical protein
MPSVNPHTKSLELVLEKRISVTAASEISDYSLRYIRRLLRSGRLEGIKIGPVWLISITSLYYRPFT